MATLEVPAQIVRYILQWVWGEEDNALYHDACWWETEAKQRAAVAGGFRWAVRFTGTRFSDFTRQVAQQSNADLFQSGGLWHYVWRMRRDPTATLTRNEQVGFPTFQRVPPRTALSATLSVSWDLNFATGEWRKARDYPSGLTAQINTRQRGRRPVGDAPLRLEMPYVPDTATAEWLARRELARRDRQRWATTVPTDWAAIAVEKGDTIRVQSPVLAQSLFVGETGEFVVTGKEYDPATDAIALTAEEAELAVLELLGDLRVETAFTLTRLGTLVVTPLITLLGDLVVGSAALLEDGTFLLLEDGTSLLLEDTPILLEDGTTLLLENGTTLLMEN